MGTLAAALPAVGPCVHLCCDLYLSEYSSLLRGHCRCCACWQCAGGHEGSGGLDHAPGCNFAALMQATGEAVTNCDLSVLSSNPVYQACVAVMDSIGNVNIAASCHGP